MLAAGAVAAALLLPGAGAVRADTQAAGGALAVEVTANLPSFPCASCSSTASGKAAGIAGGVDATTKKFVAADFALAAYNSAFTYHEACPPPSAGKPVTPVEGFANGTFSVGPGAFIKGATGTAWLTGSFNYTRVGLVAVITTKNNALRSGSPTGTQIGISTSGDSVGLFIPAKVSGNCTQVPGPPATIDVVSAAFAG